MGQLFLFSIFQGETENTKKNCPYCKIVLTLPRTMSRDTHIGHVLSYLSGTMTVGKVKGLLYRLYKVDSADQRLSYLDTKVRITCLITVTHLGLLISI